MSIDETWKPVVGYEGWYEVSDLGRVRCIVGGSGRRSPPHYLKPRSSNGRWSVMLCIFGEPVSFLIHRLVVEAFIGPIPDGMEVHHKDHDPHNNIIGNLELVSKGEHWDQHVPDRHCQLGSEKCRDCLRALRHKYDMNRRQRRREYDLKRRDERRANLHPQ